MEDVLYLVMAEKQSKRQEGDRDMGPTGHAHSDSISSLPGCCDTIPDKPFQEGFIWIIVPEDSSHSGMEDMPQELSWKATLLPVRKPEQEAISPPPVTHFFH